MDELGDRMMMYERIDTSRRVIPRLPLYLRLDGRSFHTFCADLEKPYDSAFGDAMVATARDLVGAFDALSGYTQSDEISLVWHAPETNRGSVPFEGKVHKILSCAASLCASFFVRNLLRSGVDRLIRKIDQAPSFDCRLVVLPSREEAANMVLWRERDAAKNSVLMLGYSQFDTGDLHGLNINQIQEKLHRERGINWSQSPEAFKCGTFVLRRTLQAPLSDEILSRIPATARPAPGTLFSRKKIVAVTLPPFDQVQNRADVLFQKADPIIAGDAGPALPGRILHVAPNDIAPPSISSPPPA